MEPASTLFTIMINENFLDDLQEKVSYLETVETRGILVSKVGKEYQCLCPFHEEKSPSFQIGERVGHCFGCGWKGNVFQFIMEHDGVSFIDAVREAAKTNGMATQFDPLQVEEDQRKKSTRVQMLKDAIEYWTSCLPGSPGHQYAASRGIDGKVITDFQLGYDPGDLREFMESKGHSIDDLKAAELINANGNSRFYNRLIFPILKDGDPWNIYGRAIDPDNKIKHLNLYDIDCPYNEAACQYGMVYAVEGATDTLVMVSHGYPNVIGTLGSNGVTQAVAKRIKRKRGKSIRIVPDNDPPKKGKIRSASSDSVAASIQTMLIEGLDVEVAVIPEKAYKDPADYFNAKGATAHLLPQAVTDWCNNFQIRDTITSKKLDDGLSLSFRGKMYVLTAATVGKQGVKGLLTVNDSEGEPIHRDRIDFWSATKVKSFIKDLDLDEAEKKVFAILESQMNLWEAVAATEKKGKKEIPAYAKKLATSLANDPDIIATIIKDIGDMGYVGEDENKALLFLVGVSALMKEPLGVFISAESASGKSALVEKVTTLFPPDMVFSISRMTTQALYYIQERELSQKWLVVAERQGISENEEADYSLRTFFSEQVLTLMVPQKNEETGKIETTMKKVYGPIAYTETTTSLGIHDENATRLLEINISENESQTQAVHVFQKMVAAATQAEVAAIEKKRKSIIAKYRAFIGTLKTVDVRIPYASEIRFPTGLTRARRDLKKYLGIIKAIAFINQSKRATLVSDGMAFIEANTDDYRMAYQLTKDVIRRAFVSIPDRSQRLLEELYEAFGDVDGTVDIEDDELCVFTVKEIRAKGIKKSPQTLFKYLVPLAEQDLVAVVNEGARGRGNSAKYRFIFPTIEECQSAVDCSVSTPAEIQAAVDRTAAAADEFFQ